MEAGSRERWQFQEEDKSIAQRACWKFQEKPISEQYEERVLKDQEKPKSLASRTCWRSERSIKRMLECSRKNKRAQQLERPGVFQKKAKSVAPRA